MNAKRNLFAVLLAAPLALLACGGEGESISIELVHQDCETNTPFITSASSLTFKVTGDGMEEILVEGQTGGKAEIPAIPYGKNRVVEVSALANGAVPELVAWGRSAPFDVEEGSLPKVRIAVRGANRFSTTAALNGNSCSSGLVPRMGHSAVELEDGRVLIFGGAPRVQGGVAADLHTTAEFYDPATGTFSEAPSPCSGDVCFRAVDFPAVRMNVADGPDKVVAFGGTSVDENGNPVALSTIAIFDPATNSWDLSRSMREPRRLHTATHLNEWGQVLIIGGVSNDLVVSTTTEIFELSKTETIQGPEIPEIPIEGYGHAAGRALHGATLRNRDMVAIGGGIDSNKSLAGTIQYFKRLPNGNFEAMAAGNAVEMYNPVADGELVTLGDYIVVVGGYSKVSTDLSPSTPYHRVQFYKSGGGSDSDQRNPTFARGNSCVVQLDGRRALSAGGETDLTPSPYADVITSANGQMQVAGAGGTAQNARMRTARNRASCTLLQTGEVLIFGGLSDTTNATAKAEIYSPKR